VLFDENGEKMGVVSFREKLAEKRPSAVTSHTVNLSATFLLQTLRVWLSQFKVISSECYRFGSTDANNGYYVIQAHSIRSTLSVAIVVVDVATSY